MAYTLKQVPSPNYTKGRQGNSVKYVVIHWIVGTLSAADAVFKNSNTQTSAHYGIENKVIHQYVSEANTAYHAGTWSANLQSIGIEHSAAPGRPASNDTYNSSIELIASICKKYKLNPDTAIVPHNKFVATQCPGTMDLNRIKKGVKARLNVVTSLTAALITKAYQDLLGRKPDAGGLAHYLKSGFTDAQMRADIKKSAEYKKRQDRIAADAKAKAAAEAKAKAEAAAKAAAEAAEKARLEAEAKKKAEEDAKNASKDKYAEENNSLLKQILAILKKVFNIN